MHYKRRYKLTMTANIGADSEEEAVSKSRVFIDAIKNDDYVMHFSDIDTYGLKFQIQSEPYYIAI